MMKGWSKLKPGDLIDVVAPGSATSSEALEEATTMATRLGFKVRIPAGLMSAHPFHSQEDEIRFEFLKNALYAKDSKVVWCLRGGYGSNRLIPFLNKLKTPPTKAKLFIGYSDITTVHTFLQQKWKWITCHGPVFENLKSGRIKKEDLNELVAMLTGKIKTSQFQMKPLNAQALVMKKKKTVLTGGNLATLQSAIGTVISPKLSGKTLFLEDIGERGYRVDRLLEHFRQAKILNGCEAIVLGDFTGGEEKDGADHTMFALERFANSVKVPVFYGLPCGHGVVNKPLFLGAPAVIQGGEIAHLTNHSGVKA